MSAAVFQRTNMSLSLYQEVKIGSPVSVAFYIIICQRMSLNVSVTCSCAVW